MRATQVLRTVKRFITLVAMINIDLSIPAMGGSISAVTSSPVEHNTSSSVYRQAVTSSPVEHNTSSSVYRQEADHSQGVDKITVKVIDALRQLPVWAIALITLGTLLLLFCCLFCVCQCCCRSRTKKDSEEGMKATLDLPNIHLTGNSYQEKVQPEMESLPATLEIKENPESSQLKIPKLQFSMGYDFQKEELSVDVIQAANLPGKNESGTSDPFVRVSLLLKKACKTRVQRNTLNPIFNESFTFKVPYADVSSQVLTLTVYDFDRLSKHHQIGQVQVALNPIDLRQVVEEWRDLELPDLKTESQFGDICFSLRYVPSAGKLAVIVLEAKDIRMKGDGGLPDPYVKIWIVLDEKKVKKKRTTVKKHTPNPYFNESFTFDVPFEHIKKISLIITVVDYNRIGTSEPVGRCALGCSSSGTQLRHWSAMLANPRRPIAQWHMLQEVENS